MTPAKQATKRQPPTPEQIRARQSRDAEKEHAAAVVPAPTSTAVAPLDGRTLQQRYLDDIAPASIVGRGIKFNGKDGQYTTLDDGTVLGDDVDYVALCDHTIVGHVKFRGTGEPPDRAMGPLYDGFVPNRAALGDDEPSKWELGLDGKPADPWQHHIYLVLQRGDTNELFTFLASSPTARRAVGNLLRHYNRMPTDFYPVIRLKVGGFQHRDTRVGWVSTPVLTVVGRHKKDDAAKPDSSVAADLNDQIPW